MNESAEVEDWPLDESLPPVCPARSPNGRECGSLATHVRFTPTHLAWENGRAVEEWE
jgi:hypothetical protein